MSLAFIFCLLGEGNLILCSMCTQENYFGSIGRQNNNNSKFPDIEFVKTVFYWYLSIHITSACVKSMKAARFLYFNWSSKVINKSVNTSYVWNQPHT